MNSRAYEIAGRTSEREVTGERSREKMPIREEGHMDGHAPILPYTHKSKAGAVGTRTRYRD